MVSPGNCGVNRTCGSFSGRPATLASGRRLLPDIDLRIARTATALIGVAVMLHGFLWETD